MVLVKLKKQKRKSHNHNNIIGYKKNSSKAGKLRMSSFQIGWEEGFVARFLIAF
jgi:hypothetical protein